MLLHVSPLRLKTGVADNLLPTQDLFFSLSNIIGWLGVQIPIFYAASYGYLKLVSIPPSRTSNLLGSVSQAAGLSSRVPVSQLTSLLQCPPPSCLLLSYTQNTHHPQY